ncbi:hypothetical protein K0U91_13095 [Chryseobacterium chendengshani]|uniref:hypothetical protein n=1 Tax=Chryseobacterium sp. LJ668 TaxID=2864040 RepID=UPI001C6883D2|nr:hypothetical protein [Chryseobacterium sp. LJ668]MBW8522442.1 hypothetical protein [Chryseobacterium sp. LJ668]QYK15985.1 hypothetical protein K0U91_13095 [Chryseobacterium sp. LJ668]
MYKFIFLFLLNFLSAQQACRLSFSNNCLSEKGSITFSIKNMGEKKIKIPVEFNKYWARPTDIQVYDEGEKDFLDTNYSFDGATCLDVKKCLGKTLSLKKEGIKKYDIQIIPGRITKAFKEKKKYRFKLSFDTYLFSGCNDFVTDWLYYDNNN